jgi:hypothetical protein
LAWHRAHRDNQPLTTVRPRRKNITRAHGNGKLMHL